MIAQATISFDAESGLWRVYYTDAAGAGHWSRPMALQNLERVLKQIAYKRLSDGKSSDFAVDREPVAKLLDTELVKVAIANGHTVQRQRRDPEPTVSADLLESLDITI
jgi:hypothetical protein